MAAIQTMPSASAFTSSKDSTDTSAYRPYQPNGQQMKTQAPTMYSAAQQQRNNLPELNLNYMPDRTSPNALDRHHAASRQIRAPKSPLYVPAVLRPTEKPQRQSPPSATGSGFENGAGKWDWQTSSEPVDSFAGGILRVETEDFNDDTHGPVTGPPSTNHWVPDHSTTSCSASACQRDFTFFTRRHHCRRCGNIYCREHVRNQAPLNQFALLHAAGHQSKVCDRCYTYYQQWRSRRLSRTDSDSSSSQSSPAMGIASPAMRAPTTTATNNVNVGSVSGFVGSYTWSTF